VPKGGAFADVLAANEEYAAGFELAGLSGRAGRGLAVVTCIDSRIEPLPMLGLRPGDAKILRTPGARVTRDVLDTLVLGAHLLDVARVMVVAHTDCRMAASEQEIHAAVRAAGGPDTRSLFVAAAPDPEAVLREDVQRIRSSPYLPGVDAAGFVYDVETGRVSAVC
jgi:carbonic anhydrase